MRNPDEFKIPFESISDLSTALIAGVTQAFRQHAGNVFYVDAATSPIIVSFDNRAPITMAQGQKMAVRYQGFTIKSAAVQSVVIKYGYGQFSNSNQQVSVNTTVTFQGTNTTKPNAEISVGAGLTVLLVGANVTRKMLRLAIPSSQTGEVYLTNALNTAKGGILEAGVIDYQDTEAAVYAHNYGAAAVLVSVLEMERV